MNNSITCSLSKRQQRADARGSKRKLALAVAAAALAAACPAALQAQETPRGSAALLLEEVVVTARKRTENQQDVPLSVSAFGADQIEALKIRDLTNLAVGLPNVALDEIGTAKGIANFSIRGLGINSSIPSIDPTVGLFVDGVYMGVNGGVIFDVFDLESIEVLRGPQGTLFGRNVTGGAVLLRTRSPGDEFEFSARAAVDGGGDGGLNKYVMGTVGGPLSDTVSAKLTAYYHDDDGWFENQFDGEDFGAFEQKMARGAVLWTPTDEASLIVRWEHSETRGDGPATQNHRNGRGVPGASASFDRDSHDFSIDETGGGGSDTDFVTLEYNHDVNFGDGTVTNILGWRAFSSTTSLDVDGQPQWLFHSGSWSEFEQWSNELRYSGLFGGNTSVTAGVFYFNNEIEYHERRELLGVLTGGVAPAIQFDGGGFYEVETFSVFAAVDYELNDRWTLSAGINYSNEEKATEVAYLSRHVNENCNIVLRNPGCDFDFIDDDKWSNWSPKLGATYHVSDNMRIYGHWSRGIRSGGYNLRNTSFDPAQTPGPFQEETVDNIELGVKSEFGRGRLNAALFMTRISDMQRELNLPSQGAGVIQLVKNTADAEILGLEVDAAFGITESLLLIASLGWLDPEYTDVFLDLNGDGIVDAQDEALNLPRAAELTYSLGLTHDLSLGQWGYMSSRVSYGYRDESAYTDDNLGFILEQKNLDAGIDFYSNDGHWSFGIYGRNLLNEVKHGGDSQLPDQIGPVGVGGTFSPLAKGRIVGVEVKYAL